MAIAATELRRFEYAGGPEAREFRTTLVQTIANSRFTIEYLRDRDNPRKSDIGQTFGVFIKPNREAKARYGIDREVLVWCSTFPSFSARDTNNIRKIQAEHGTRLSSMFTVLVTRYARGDRSAIEVESGDSQTIVHVTFDDIRDRSLDELLASTLFSRDPFDLAGAVVRSADFFGRREQIDRTVAEIESGTSQLGIFGLRKAGKTSLLNRLYEKLQNSARVYVARIDLQWTTAINDSPEYTAWALGESIFASHKDIRRIPGLRLFGKYDTFADIPSREAVWEWLANDFSLVANRAKRPICLLIDEIERMYEGSAPGFVRFWRVIRGLDQQTPGRLRVVVGGTSPQCAEEGYVGEQDNPMFKYLRVHYLGPLSAEDCGEMLASLGRLAGLEFTEDALSRAYASTGGHPALVRALGSAVHTSRSAKESGETIDASSIRDANGPILQNSSSLIDQMLASLAAQYPDEHELLIDLAKGRVHNFRALASEFPKEYRRLVNYGLASDETVPRVKIGQLQSRIQRIDQLKSRSAGDLALDVGSEVDGWSIKEPIAQGGFAEVYRVQNRSGDDRALKVFNSSNAAIVAREVDVLREFNHSNIVEFYDVIATDDGRPCLLMEFLNGRPLSDYCSADLRPPTADWSRWLIKMLDALADIHPASIKPISAEMSFEEYREWNHSKHGFVHRDIKPENIIVVEVRGPVLFDFNISSKVGDAVLTTSLTPGYAPPLNVDWGPEVDLYALAVTFAELGSGGRLRDSSIDDLKTSLEANHGRRALTAVNYLLTSRDRNISTRDIATTVRKLMASGRL